MHLTLYNELSLIRSPVVQNKLILITSSAETTFLIECRKTQLSLCSFFLPICQFTTVSICSRVGVSLKLSQWIFNHITGSILYEKFQAAVNNMEHVRGMFINDVTCDSGGKEDFEIEVLLPENFNI